MNDRPPLLRPFEPLTWAEDAPCTQVDSEEFFPEKNLGGGAAKRLCWTCDVRRTCLQYALAHHEWGIWGGTSGTERRRIRKQRAKDALDFGESA